jgi:hypothetical protein
MLYYFENAELTECKTFGYSHYKPRTGREKTIIMHKKKLRYFPITYRLQTLFMSPKTVEHMTWHQSHDAVDEVKCGNIFTMCILTFQLNQGMCILDYIETDSIHLGHLLLLILVSRLYLWFTTSPGICMRLEFMFLSTVIPNPNSPGRDIVFYLRLLIDELKQLWSFGALTYDVSTKHNLLIKVALMWTINDFLAYRMVYGWSIHRKLVCPYCIENNKAFTLINGGKTSFFYYHQCFLLIDHKYRRNINDFFIGKVEKNVAPLRLSCEELYDMVSRTVTLCLVFNSVSRSFQV